MDYLYDLFIQQNGQCAISGIKISLGNGKPGKLRTASLDRIDNTKGYVYGNVWWVHKHINKIKRTLTCDELKFWCQKVVDYEINSKN
jgi:hypothetical protein